MTKQKQATLRNLVLSLDRLHIHMSDLDSRLVCALCDKERFDERDEKVIMRLVAKYVKGE